MSEAYPILAVVTNEEGKAATASPSVTVTDAGPQITPADLSLSEPVANEGDTITLDGQFTNPGSLNPVTVTIDWGDGSTPTVLYGLFNEIATSATPGLYTFSVTHHYEDNPPGELTGGAYDIQVSVSDGAVTVSANTSIVVNHVAPSIRIESAGSAPSGTVDLTSVVTHPGAARPRR